MPTQINQIDDEERGVTIFRVDGEMFREDAELLGRIAADVQSENGNSIMIDLADLDFLDSESATVLMKLERENGFEIIGTEIFLQTVVDAAEGHPHRT
ncbi:MAG: STAS domain-containing protein [Pyrinomonadaceae bacterium]